MKYICIWKALLYGKMHTCIYDMKCKNDDQLISVSLHKISEWCLSQPEVPLFVIIIIIISLIRQVGSDKRKIQIKYKIQNKQTTMKKKHRACKHTDKTH